MNLMRTWIFVSFCLISLISCTPSITIKPPQNLEEGSRKVIAADVSPACGYNRAYAMYKKNTDTNWLNSGLVRQNGNSFTSIIPGSENFRAPDIYDFRWLVDYDQERKMSGACRTIAASTVQADASFTVPTCTPNNLTILSVTLRPQETSMWCWAASARMVMEFLGTTVRQCTEANDNFGRIDCCNDDAGVCGANPNQYRANHAGCIQGSWPDFGHYNFDSNNVWRALTWDELKRQISNTPNCRAEPVAFAWQWIGGGGHMMVAYGYFEFKLLWLNSQWVQINDPWAPCVGDSRLITYDEYDSRPGDHTHWRDYFNVKITP